MPNINALTNQDTAIVDTDKVAGAVAGGGSDNWQFTTLWTYIAAKTGYGVVQAATSVTTVATTSGTTTMDSSGGAVDLTLADGTVIGQEKIFKLIDDTTESTVEVATHITDTNELFTFPASGGNTYLILKWMGTGIGWITIDATATV